jgi:glycerol-3-phosphate dehydrogenase
MHREAMRAALDAARDPWDVLVIGGGATGLGCALESVTRGFRTALVEQRDFASGTSSRSTKLFHGGVRYLRGGHFLMVAQSLREREHARRATGALVRDTVFLVPVRSTWESFYYSAGLRLYDLLARDHATPRSSVVSHREALALAPTLRSDSLHGGVTYHDYQFDDARFAIELARCAAARGAILLNYAPVTGLLYEGERVAGAIVRDAERGDSLEVRARVVVNAAGVYADSVRRMRSPSAAPLIRFSRGTHIVIDRSFLPGDTAVLVPRTDDDRVVFLIPWRGRVLIGTTDVPVYEPSHEPHATLEEIDYLLEHAARYLTVAPSRSDVRSAFAGLRPLPAVEGRSANVLRDHRVEVSGGMVSISGGKWTTYRLMANDAIAAAALEGRLSGMPHPAAELGAPPESNVKLEAALLARQPLTPEDAREITRLVREEMARSVEDVLARRTRVLFLDAKCAAEAAPAVAQALALALGRDASWISEQIRSFTALAKSYLPD